MPARLASQPAGRLLKLQFWLSSTMALPTPQNTVPSVHSSPTQAGPF